MALEFDRKDNDLLSNCILCPRECAVNRFKGREGYCGTDSGLNIASICIHRGEEPPISGPDGICNIFFSGCNLRCSYCQNHDISQPYSHVPGKFDDIDLVLDQVGNLLLNGAKAVGFVSPSHVVPQMKAIITGLHRRGLHPIIVYNTNSYDRPETLHEISSIIDIYLPDMKYATRELALEYSDSADYPDIALRAIKEMYYQKGSLLRMDENGMAENGILLRHLVLPGHAEESKKVLRLLAEEISTGISISLMSQYHPVHQVRYHPVLSRTIYAEEYLSVVEEMERLGFRNGWLQDPGSNDNYLPDFSRDHPFEK
ncbi:MAG: radical SAM protein [Bacteroidales bacterium]|jgi:putative pyruvate formate lyase activating enzyme